MSKEIQATKDDLMAGIYFCCGGDNPEYSCSNCRAIAVALASARAEYESRIRELEGQVCKDDTTIELMRDEITHLENMLSSLGQSAKGMAELVNEVQLLVEANNGECLPMCDQEKHEPKCLWPLEEALNRYSSENKTGGMK
jgi:uncharacterized coiled-coil protein SlyX